MLKNIDVTVNQKDKSLRDIFVDGKFVISATEFELERYMKSLNDSQCAWLTTHCSIGIDDPLALIEHVQKAQIGFSHHTVLTTRWAFKSQWYEWQMLHGSFEYAYGSFEYIILDPAVTEKLRKRLTFTPAVYDESALQSYITLNQLHRRFIAFNGQSNVLECSGPVIADVALPKSFISIRDKKWFADERGKALACIDDHQSKVLCFLFDSDFKSANNNVKLLGNVQL